MNSSAQNNTTFAERAALLTSRGIPVVPVNAGQKRCTVPDWPKLATTDPDLLNRWPSDSNTAAVCLPGGICVLDADAAGLVARIEQDAGETMPQTFMVKSGGKGFPHIYFTHTERSTALGNRHAQGLFDFQADRKYVVGPGSVLENGGVYEITCDAPIAPIPAWMCDWIESNSEAEKRLSKGTTVPVHPDFDIDALLEHYGLVYDVQGKWYVTDVCPIAGHKHEQSTQTGFYFDGETFGFHCSGGNCAGAGMTVGQVIRKLNDPQESKIRKPYAGPIWKELTESPRSFPYTEGGNAERLVAEHANSFGYLPTIRCGFSMTDGGGSSMLQPRSMQPPRQRFVT